MAPPLTAPAPDPTPRRLPAAPPPAPRQLTARRLRGVRERRTVTSNRVASGQDLVLQLDDAIVLAGRWMTGRWDRGDWETGRRDRTRWGLNRQKNGYQGQNQDDRPPPCRSRLSSSSCVGEALDAAPWPKSSKRRAQGTQRWSPNSSNLTLGRTSGITAFWCNTPVRHPGAYAPKKVSWR